MKKNEFKCESCKNIFENARSDEEARAEANELWGNVEDLAIVCDDCFNELINYAMTRN